MKEVLAAIPAPAGTGAEITNPALGKTLTSLFGQTNPGLAFINLLLPNFIVLFLIIASVVAFFFLIIGGIRYITSSGDKTQAEAAQGQITKAIIGLVLVFSVFAIMTLIGDFLGINLLKITIDKLMLK